MQTKSELTWGDVFAEVEAATVAPVMTSAERTAAYFAMLRDAYAEAERGHAARSAVLLGSWTTNDRPVLTITPRETEQ